MSAANGSPTTFLAVRCLELLDELVVDAGLDVDAGAGTAALAVVEEDTEVDP